MAGVWKGVTDFLEKVDHKAAEIADESAEAGDGGGVDAQGYPPAAAAGGHGEVEDYGWGEDEVGESGGGTNHNDSQVPPPAADHSSAPHHQAPPADTDSDDFDLYEGSDDAQQHHAVAPAPAPAAVPSKVPKLAFPPRVPTDDTTQPTAPRSHTHQENAEDRQQHQFHNNHHGEVVSLRKQLDALQRSKNEMEATFESAMKNRDNRYMKLQSDFDNVNSQVRRLESDLQSAAAATEEAHQSTRQAVSETEQLKDRLKEADFKYTTLQQQAQVFEQEWSDIQVVAESSQRDAAVAVEMTRKLEGALKAAQFELSDYKTKSRVLIEDKDRIIEELQHNSATTGGGGGGGSHSSEEVAELLADLGRQRSEAAAQLEAVQRELQDRLDAQSSKLAVAQQDLRRAEEEQRNAKEAADESEMRAASFGELLDGEKSAHISARAAFDAALLEKSEELKILERKLHAIKSSPAGGRAGAQTPTDGSADANTSVSGVVAGAAGERGAGRQQQLLDSEDFVPIAIHAEVERRARELADLVMEKQAALEAKRTEADQWRTRYEVSQQRLREAEMVSSSLHSGIASSSASGGGGSRYTTRSVDMSGVDDGAGAEASEDFRRSQFFTTLSRRGQWGERIADVAERIDKVGLRTGIVLRRSSVLRVAVIIYVIILQLWAFFAITVNSSLPAGNASLDSGPKL